MSTENEVLRQLTARRSVRVFTDKPIPEQDRLAILDAAAQAPFFLCPGAGGRRRIIWYEDSRSLLARLELARSRGLAGVSLWPQDRLYRPGLHMLQSRCAGEKLV